MGKSTSTWTPCHAALYLRRWLLLFLTQGGISALASLPPVRGLHQPSNCFIPAMSIYWQPTTKNKQIPKYQNILIIISINYSKYKTKNQFKISNTKKTVRPPSLWNSLPLKTLSSVLQTSRELREELRSKQNYLKKWNKIKFKSYLTP